MVENADFLAYQGLVNGEGHVIPLQENLYTADGIGPTRGGGPAPTFVATANKFDGGDYYVEYGGFSLWSAEQINHTAASDFTVCWVTEKSPSGHHILAITGTGATSDPSVLKYKDGATSTGSEFNNVQLIADGLMLFATAGAAEYKKIHEIVFLPFKLTASQMETITTRTKRFSALPYITVSGDMVDGDTVTCAGTSGTSDFVPSSFSGAFGANNSLSFTLQEK